MADSSGVMKIGLVGAAVFVAYRQGWLSSFGIGAPAAVVPPAGTTPAPGGTVTPPSSPSQLDVIYGRMVAEAVKEGVGAAGTGVDRWDVFATRGGAPDPLPSPETVFGANARAADMTAMQYWAGMAPYLRTNFGLKGLGCFGDLACMACGGNY